MKLEEVPLKYCMSNTFTKQITNKFGVSHVSGITIGVEGAAAVTRTDTNPYLQEIYNLMEDFFKPSLWTRVPQKCTVCY